MDNDFNTAGAIGVLNNLTSDVNKFINDINFEFNLATKNELKQAKNLLNDILEVLGINFETEKKVQSNDKFEQLIDYILDIREQARENKNYELADEIRDNLKDMGIDIKDAPHGVEWELKED